MANTTKLTNRSITITGLDADWTIPNDLADHIKTGLRVKSIGFDPGAANDRLVIKAGKGSQLTATDVLATNTTAGGSATTAATIFDVTVTAVTDQRIKYFDGSEQMWPFIDISDCTLATSGAGTSAVNIELS